ncbi:hypothetical protein ACFL59_12230 [Planctomycetota bacterium]
MRWVGDHVERRLYSFDDLCDAFCRRSAWDLLRDPHIHFATPCHDLATVALGLLLEAGATVTPVLARIKRPLQPVKFQCGLELVAGQSPYYAGFSITTNRVAPGRMVAEGARTEVHRANHGAAPRGAPFLAFFGLSSPHELDGFLRGHRLSRHLRSYRPTTRPRAFERARKRALAKCDADRSGELLGPGSWRRVGAGGGVT